MRLDPIESATSLKAQVLEVAALVNYQSGSIVSREIIKKVGGSVTLFAFDEDQGLSEHTSPYDALVNILEGAADITVSGQLHHLQAGQLIIMPAGEPHALKATSKFKMMLTLIKT
ncbi:MAG: cupin domain-containing protein, partial [Cyanobacteria bacterium SZAS LIN-2]|nr:cupin domain-containing protein [Cyanobacteria bacterium SZAS LIN-2]MBS2009878.1 cupin domain-containing protein [Cyanobacteria bacterium SZAS TMP-1]